MAPHAGPGRAVGLTRLAVIFALSAAILFLTHWPCLNLPFFWDELGYYIPAALDLYREGAWVPRTTVPNVHPPGLQVYLAAAWRWTGYSIPATRSAMLFVAAGAATGVYLLALRLCGRPSCAQLAVAFLLASPLVYTQAMMAQLDLPAALFTVLALLAFLSNRIRASAVLSVLLVLIRETGIVVPFVLALWLLRERSIRPALWYLLPAVALGGWLVVLKSATGHWFGDREFTAYNVWYALHPVRVALATGRRLVFLLCENFHWIGWLAIGFAWRRVGFTSSRDWHVTGTVFTVQLIALSLVGGAVLERYLLPVLPLMFAATAAAWMNCLVRWRAVGLSAMLAGLVASHFWGPPYPHPLENNLEMIDFVRVHQDAAAFLDAHYPEATVTTAWPLSAALRREDYGYVSRPLRVNRLADFRPSTLAGLSPAEVEVFVLYSRDAEPEWNLLRLAPLEALRMRYYGYEPQMTGEELAQRLGLKRIAMWTRHTQWVEVLARSDLAGPPSPPPR